MSNTVEKLPHWNLDSIYPGLESEPFEQAMGDLSRRVDDLDHFLNEHSIAPAPGQQAV